MKTLFKLIKNKKDKGFSLIELIVGGAIVAISFTAIVTFILTLQKNTYDTVDNTKAVDLAKEALEAVRKIRDDGWANITAKTVATDYCPVLASGQWTFPAAPCTAVSGYTTKVTFSTVNRDGNDDITTSGGTSDANARKVDAVVTWNQSGTKTVTLSTYITNFENK